MSKTKFPKATVARRRVVFIKFLEQNGLCWFCGIQCRLSEPGSHGIRYPNTATLEHLTFQFRVMACHQCNNEKGRISDLMTRKGVRK